MKQNYKLFTLTSYLFLSVLLFSSVAIAQQPAYYNNTDLTKTGTALKPSYSNLITNTQTTNLSYTPGVWDALKQTDIDPNNPNKVLLIYGSNDNDGNYITDRTRDKDANGGTNGTDWNREPPTRAL